MGLLFTILISCIPLVVLAWVLPEKWQLLPVVLVTACFLAVVSPISFVILLFTTLSSYAILKYSDRLTTAMLIIVLQGSTIFIFFKLEYGLYFNLLDGRLLPLGLSYYSFRQIHYAIEAYKKQLPQHTLMDYLNYLFFLPTILIGPINRFQPFLKDYRRRRWDSTLFSQGLERILYGLAKIVILGNYLFSQKVNAFALSLLDESVWLATYIQVVKYAANAYVQFSGYSDVAIGLSLLFGFKVTENFNYPFLAKNIADFWTRWHISLSEWCRDYVFYPFLSISRKAWVSILMSMFVLGAWHEISVRYLLWAAIHALAITVWHRYESSSLSKKMSTYPIVKQCLGIFITLNFVILSFILVSEKDLSASLEILKVLFFLN